MRSLQKFVQAWDEIDDRSDTLHSLTLIYTMLTLPYPLGICGSKKRYVQSGTTVKEASFHVAVVRKGLSWDSISLHEWIWCMNVLERMQIPVDDEGYIQRSAALDGINTYMCRIEETDFFKVALMPCRSVGVIPTLMTP